MSELFPIFFGAGILLVLSLLVFLFVRVLNKEWWRMAWIRRAIYFLPVAGILGIVFWGVGQFTIKKTMAYIGATVTALDIILILALLVSLPVSGVLNGIQRLIDRRRNRGPKEPDTTAPIVPRRRFLKAAAAAVPIVALTSGASGVAHAFSDIKVYRKKIYFKNLPPELEGFRILHLSDIHIGYYTWLENVEDVLLAAGEFSPHIVCATGDHSDRLDVYPDVLKLFDQFKAPYGVFASLGNHEYYRGIRRVLAAYDKSPVPLLVNSGQVIEHNGYPIFFGGADDPRSMGRENTRFFRKTIDNTLLSAPSHAFRILLSHRPRAFDLASEAGYHFVLSGHTHGGQIGLAGRSILEPVFPENYLWGEYSHGDNRLYTSAGMGHWFPFRLGCPAEAPVLELTGNKET